MEVVIILIASTFLILLLGILFVIALLIQQKRKFRHRQQIVEMKEQTFTDISQILHDNIASHISTAMLLLHPHPAISKEVAEQNKERALQTLDKVIDDMKNLARYMNPSFLDAIGLQEAIRRQLGLINQVDGMKTQLVAGEYGATLSSEQQLVFFRIFQECLNNAIRHSYGKNITVRIMRDKHFFRMDFTDDGNGFDVGRIERGGMGIVNMRERSRLIGASFDIESKPGNGTTIIVSLPIKMQEQ